MLKDQETEEEREARLQARRERRSLNRQQERTEQRDARLEERRNRVAVQRQQQTADQREAALMADRLRHVARKQLETPEQYEAGLQRDRLRMRIRRQQASFHQRQAWGETERLRIATKREAHFIRPLWDRGAFYYNPNFDYGSDPIVSIGGMSEQCPECGALKWKRETSSMCCSLGKVKLPLLHEPPQLLKDLLLANTSASRHFLNSTRLYNCAFQMTSFQANVITERGFMPTFKVQGQIYHILGSLQPLQKEPQFLQLYFMGNLQAQAERRCGVIPGTHINIVLSLQEMIHQVNTYVQSFKYVLEHPPTLEYRLVLDPEKRPYGQHRGRFNAPTYNEVAVVLSGIEHGKRDIVLKHRDNSIQRINEFHRSYDALQYPLIHVFGEDGYHFIIPQTSGTKTVSCMDFYAYHLMIRSNYFCHLHRFHDLFHQYLVDMYAKVETERLLFIKSHQKELRVESYVHLRDGINNDAGREGIGQLYILPSSFTGGPRYMHERTQDAMSYVRHYGRPDLFITFTCNPT